MGTRVDEIRKKRNHIQKCVTFVADAGAVLDELQCALLEIDRLDQLIQKEFGLYGIKQGYQKPNLLVNKTEEELEKTGTDIENILNLILERLYSCEEKALAITNL